MWASIMIKLVNKFKRLELCMHLEVESAQEGGRVEKGAETISHWSLTLMSAELAPCSLGRSGK